MSDLTPNFLKEGKARREAELRSGELGASVLPWGSRMQHAFPAALRKIAFAGTAGFPF